MGIEVAGALWTVECGVGVGRSLGDIVGDVRALGLQRLIEIDRLLRTIAVVERDDEIEARTVRRSGLLLAALG